MKRLFAVAAVLLILCLPSFGYAEEEEPEFVMNDYRREITVYENNVCLVQDAMTVTFLEEAHGLWVDIPLRWSTTRESGGRTYTNTYEAEVSEVRADREAEMERVGDDIIVRIGSPDTYVNGQQTYFISYLYDIGDDGIKEFDEFYYNLIAPSWDAPIEHFSFAVYMPKSFDAEKIGFSIGRAGQEGYREGELVYGVDGNTVYGELTRGIAPLEGVTMRMELPEGYFVNERWRIEPAYIMMAIGIGITVVLGGLLATLGKRKKAVATVEFYPPIGMTPADVGYVADGEADSKDVVSLLIYWADRGYIEIHELEKRNLELRKLRGLPEQANDYEKLLFDEIFENGDSNTVFDMQFKMHETVKEVTGMVRRKYGSGEKRIFEPKSLQYHLFARLLFPVPALLMTLCRTNVSLWDCIMFVIMFWPLCFIAGGYFDSTMKKASSMRKLRRTGILVISAAMAAGCCIMPGWAMFLRVGWPAIVASACSLLILLFLPYYERRTEQGRQWEGKILGFRQFLAAAEAERIGMLAGDDPRYFYDILPYAYVLGVSDEWAKRFEGIAMYPPNWYYGPGDGTFSAALFMGRMTRHLNFAASSMALSRSSRRGGSSGGGFSGGGAGGGGGSW